MKLIECGLANSKHATGLIALVVLALIAISPAFLVEIPAMADYPNHLARMYILAKDKTPAANPFYQVDWALYPNLAMDLLVPPMARFMSVEFATKLFFVISQLLIVTGAMAIEFAVKKRHEISGYAALLILYSLPFAWGFVNFEFGLGMALWGIASWLAFERRNWLARLTVHAAFVFMLFFAHLFALGAYGAAIGFYELSRMFGRKFDFRNATATVTVLAFPAFLLVIIFAMVGTVGSFSAIWHFFWKPIWLALLVNGYNIPLSAFSTAVIIGLLYVLIKNQWLAVAPPGRWIAAGFLLLFLVMPFRLQGIAYVDVRVLVAATLILPAFASLSLATNLVRWVAVSIVTLIVIVNTAFVAQVWLSYKVEYDAIKLSFSLISPGSFVLVGSSGEGANPPEDLTERPILHAPTLAVHYASAFVPSFYAVPGMQPVRVRPALKQLAIIETLFLGPVPLSVLKAIAGGRISSAIPRHVRYWPHEFDYLYLVGSRIANPLPDLLLEVVASERFVLYQVRK